MGRRAIDQSARLTPMPVLNPDLNSVSNPASNRVTDLDDKMRAAHTAGDAVALVTLYTQAADLAQAGGAPDAAGFYLTHAYVFALQCHAPQRTTLNARLVALGRDAPLPDGA